jgi:hypothetical protein
MKNKFDKIDESLDIESTQVVKDVVVDEFKSIQKIDKTSPLDSYDEDFQYTRGNLYSLIEKAQQAVNEVLEVAQQSDSPRAYEVVFQGIKHAADVTDKLIDLQQKMKKLNESGTKSPTTVNNTLFVGSTAELQKLLKQEFSDDK